MAGEIKTVALTEEEKKERANHVIKISKATLEVEQILLKYNLTWGDWGLVIDTMNDRTKKVFDGITVKEINQKYGGSI
jgi:hypothetical protein